MADQRPHHLPYVGSGLAERTHSRPEMRQRLLVGVLAERQAGAERRAAGLGAEVVSNEQIKARDLPGALQNMVLSLSLGETTAPFGSIADGVRVLMLCGRDDPKVESGPDFDTVQSQMEDERVNKRAQSYLRDLRRDAVIDYGS